MTVSSSFSKNCKPYTWYVFFNQTEIPHNEQLWIVASYGEEDLRSDLYG